MGFRGCHLSIFAAAEKQDQLLLSQTINHSFNLMDYRPYFRSANMHHNALGVSEFFVTFPVWVYAKAVLTQQQATLCGSVPEPPGLQGHMIGYS